MGKRKKRLFRIQRTEVAQKISKSLSNSCSRPWVFAKKKTEERTCANSHTFLDADSKHGDDIGMRPDLLHDPHLLQEVPYLPLGRVLLGRLHRHEDRAALVVAQRVRLGLPNLEPQVVIDTFASTNTDS